MSQAAIAALGDLSGTAYWVARYRAMETERRSPLFRDPWAAQLAGERGRTIVDTLPSAKSYAWSIVMRTLTFDKMIADQLQHGGFDTVINLAAGLDTRAFRLDIPRAVRWYDVDTAITTQYKSEVLRDVEPHCRWSAVAADLSDQSKRRVLLSELCAGARKVLVVSEGLLLYLSEIQVDALSRDLHAQPSVQAWVFDLTSPESLTAARRMWGPSLHAVNARMQFAPFEGAAFFEPSGWQLAELVSTIGEGLRLHRVPWVMAGFLRLGKALAPASYEALLSTGTVRLTRCPEK